MADIALIIAPGVLCAVAAAMELVLLRSYRRQAQAAVAQLDESRQHAEATDAYITAIQQHHSVRSCSLSGLEDCVFTGQA